MAQMFRFTRKIRNTQNILQHRHASTAYASYSSSDAVAFISRGDDLGRSRTCGLLGREAAANMSVGCSLKTKAFSTAFSLPNLARTTTTMSFSVSSFRFRSNVLRLHAASVRFYSDNSELPPHQEIGMPSLSPTMTEGNIARWLKKEGDKISPGEVLCEVETDKATVEMECMEEGYLAKIVKGDGAQNIKVGEIIAVTVEEEEGLSEFKNYQVSASSASSAFSAETKAPSETTTASSEEKHEPVESPEPKVSQTEETSHSEDRIFSSPLARKLAEDNNVILSSLKGTGPDGRIVKADVEDYLASTAKTVPHSKTTSTEQALKFSDIPNSQIRKVTASRLLLSKQTIPHYYLTIDTCVDNLMRLRGELNSFQEASGGKRISVNDLVIKAAALSLQKVPQCNSSWMNDFIRQYHNVNINVAVQTDNGLLVPVVKDADKKGLSKIAEEVKSLAQKAKENSLKPEEYEGGTFTITNLGGPFGIKQFCAIINPPQSCILAVGSAERRVIPGAGPEQFEFGSFMSVTLSCDHRVVDGAVGAEWLKAFKGYIENPTSLLL